jgi:hypothetical protein
MSPLGICKIPVTHWYERAALWDGPYEAVHGTAANP